MDRLKEFRTTFFEAFTWRRPLVIGGMIGFASFVATVIVPRIPWIGQPTLLNTAPWAWTVMAFLVAVVVVLFEYAHRMRMKLVPVFELSFDPDECVAETPTIVGDMSSGVFVPVESRGAYVRIKITAVEATVKDCVAYITKIEKMDKDSGEFSRMKQQVSIRLTPEPITVYPDIPHFVDIVSVGKHAVVLICLPVVRYRCPGNFRTRLTIGLRFQSQPTTSPRRRQLWSRGRVRGTGLPPGPLINRRQGGCTRGTPQMLEAPSRLRRKTTKAGWRGPCVYRRPVYRRTASSATAKAPTKPPNRRSPILIGSPFALSRSSSVITSPFAL
jgi:hypothetical protein